LSPTAEKSMGLTARFSLILRTVCITWLNPEIALFSWRKTSNNGRKSKIFLQYYPQIFVYINSKGFQNNKGGQNDDINETATTPAETPKHYQAVHTKQTGRD
jgi:hypothetical protein